MGCRRVLARPDARVYPEAMSEGVLEGQVAIVTGARRGIGRGVALRLAEAGARIVIGDIEDASGAVAQIREQGGGATSLIMDVGLPEDADALAALAVERYGRLDILVNNAAIVPNTESSAAWNMPDRDWRRMIEVNLSGAFYCARAALPAMLGAGSGCIVNISSRSAAEGSKGDPPAYGASKAGLMGLTTALSAEVAGSGVRVNAVLPALVASGDHGWSADKIAEKAREYPLGVGTVEDIAEAVLYLVSPAARWVSGTHLYLSGGRQKGLAWL